MVIKDNEFIDIPTPAGPMRTHVLYPVAEGRYPGIVLFSEIFQVTGPIRRSAAVLAGHGFVVVIPERMLDRGQVNCFEASVQNDVVECIKRACRTNEPEWLPALSETNDLSLSNSLIKLTTHDLFNFRTDRPPLGTIRTRQKLCGQQGRHKMHGLQVLILVH